MKRVPKPRGGKSPAPSAYSSALGWLARRDHSTRELKTKLAARGHAASEAGEAIGRLKEQRYQSDERFAETLARSRAGQGYGPRRIRAELKSHGLGEPLIRATLTGLDVDFEASAASVLSRRFAPGPADAPERARRAQFLLRRGFDPATVRAVTRAEVDDPGESD